MFAYCNNNPVSSEDSSGHSFVSIIKEINKIICTAQAASYSSTYKRMANCYAFAFKLTKDPRTDKAFTEKPQPGEFGGAYYFDTIIDIGEAQGGIISYKDVKNAIMSGVNADGSQLGFSVKEVNSASYPAESGQWVVALGFSSNVLDYHWWRRMPNGLWFHKPGEDPVSPFDCSGNLIFDPGNCNRGIYDQFFGYFLVTPND